MSAEVTPLPTPGPVSSENFWTQYIERLGAIEERLTAVETQLEPIADAADDIKKLWKFAKWSVPVIVGAMYSAGIIQGPLGQAIKFIADHWPQ